MWSTKSRHFCLCHLEVCWGLGITCWEYLVIFFMRLLRIKSRQARPLVEDQSCFLNKHWTSALLSCLSYLRLQPLSCCSCCQYTHHFVSSLWCTWDRDYVGSTSWVSQCMTSLLLPPWLRLCLRSGSTLLPPGFASCPYSVYTESFPIIPFWHAVFGGERSGGCFLLTSASWMKPTSSQDTAPGWIQFSRLGVISSTIQSFHNPAEWIWFHENPVFLR